MSHYHTTNANNKKGIWIIAGTGVFVLLLGAALFFSSLPPQNSQPASSAAVKGSSLQASEQSYDFGTVSMAKGKVSKVFKITNSTNQAVTLQKLYTSCMCTSASVSVGGKRVGPFGMPGHGSVPTINVNLEAGAEAEVEVVYDPAAHGPAGVGPISREVYVETTDGGKLALEIKAQVTP